MGSTTSGSDQSLGGVEVWLPQLVRAEGQRVKTRGRPLEEAPSQIACSSTPLPSASRRARPSYVRGRPAGQRLLNPHRPALLQVGDQVAQAGQPRLAQVAERLGLAPDDRRHQPSAIVHDIDDPRSMIFVAREPFRLTANATTTA